MKKITKAYLMLATVTFTVQTMGLGYPSQAEAAVSTTTTSQSESVQNISNTFEQLLRQPGKLPQAFAYLQKHIQSIPASQATIMTLHLENAQTKQLDSYSQALYPASVQTKINTIYKPGDSFTNVISRTKDTNLKKLLTQTRDAGYKLETAEGMYYPVINYEKYKVFGKHTTADIRSYIDIMAVESGQAATKDAALHIGYQQLSGRVLAQEDFLNKYPHSNRTLAVKELHDLYYFYTFYGTNNTPLFDYDTKKILPNAKKGYQLVIQRNSGSASPYVQKLKDFVALLDQNGDKHTAQVSDWLKKNVPTS
ncbi:hypothetical protein ABH892_004812 [Paenibacillus sp. RC254]|uniref:hypothetical protein n=1 Tax=unclassified Paenibacillus TaxID=185978 RepID=UPI0024BB11BE|nr:hypothetical protein [Paenibacillus sp. RC334]